ncbi:MAG TPA: CGNR zinc finger domain-containing protein [Gaiellaceae bacterium]|nr:CGNR zinc finger domain-containing protein [Gaiellaceae bacterium]
MVSAQRLPPYRQLVDGLVLPLRVGGQPALDFCNTSAGRDEPDTQVEYLLSFDHLAVFAREAGLIDATGCRGIRARGHDHPEDAGGVLADALELREALRRVCVSEDRRRDRELVAAWVEKAAGAADFDIGSGPAASWSLPTELDLPLLAVARSAATLLTAEKPVPIRSCPGRNCGWLFLDPTNRRRWCSMATCGNREKVRRHAARARVARR